MNIRRIDRASFVLLAIVTAAHAASGAPAARTAAVPHAAPAAVDWVDHVVATPDGGFLMGNPAARVKVVEYGSRTCPHCARFAA